MASLTKIPTEKQDSRRRDWIEFLGGHHRGACSCGWRGTWRDARYLAGLDRGRHLGAGCETFDVDDAETAA